jgi:hypothetical protein
MERDNSNPDNKVYRPLHDHKISSFLWDIQANWSPTIEKEIIAELKRSVAERGKKNKPKSTVQALCLFVAGLGLLSLGLCMQANAVMQALREAARISVQQAIPSLSDR